MASEERVLAALREGRQRLEQRIREPIAIVGIGCRFPGGVRRPEDMWRLVSSEIDAVGEQPDGRWDAASFYDPDPDATGKAYVTRGGFIDGVDLFDAEFFGISPREAAAMDPQQRLLLEVTWQSLEHAGITPATVKGSRTGVYVGYSWRDYDRISVGARIGDLNAYTGLGNTASIAAGRIAHTLDLTGPVAVVDSACSSSLVAVHNAVQALRAQECDMALAGGVNLILSPFSTVFCCKIRALSRDGRCKTFDASADGYGRAEGCGIVVLKRLSDARHAGDFVHGLILGSAVGHDGHTAGLTVPSGPAQQRVIQQALNVAAVQPNQVGYVEAHGTGTALGDPIEVGALNAVFDDPDRPGPLWIGSVKTNFGHAETAAGIAGLIKVIMALRNQHIPPSLHFQQPNPHIDWSSGPARVAITAQPWPIDAPIAGVSSFGFSGTNAHMLVTRYESDQPEKADEALTPMLTISARTASAVRRQCRQYADALRDTADENFARFCRTANTRRTPFPYRLAVQGASREAIATALDSVANDERAAHVVRGEIPQIRNRKVGILIPHRGNGAGALDQHLYRRSATIRDAIDQCVAIAEPTLGPALADQLFTSLTPAQAAANPSFADVVDFIHNYAIVSEIIRWQLPIIAVSGVGTGEFVAGVTSGLLDLRDALTALASARSPDSGDIVVCAGDADALRAAVEVAGGAISGQRRPEYLIRPRRSLPSDVIEALSRAGFIVDRLADRRTALVLANGRTVGVHPPEVPFLSLETAAIADRESAGEHYWSERPLWLDTTADPVSALRNIGCDVLIEPSPRNGAARYRAEDDRAGATWIHAGFRLADLSRCAAKLFVTGALHDLTGYHGGTSQPASIPTYPFEPKYHWHGGVADPVNNVLPQRHRFSQQPHAGSAATNARQISAVIASHVKAILHSEPGQVLDLELPLHDLGFDSLMAVELRDRINEHYRLDLDAGFAYNHPSVSTQATALAALLGPDGITTNATATNSDSISPRPRAGDADAELTEHDVVALALAELSELEADQHD